MFNQKCLNVNNEYSNHYLINLIITINLIYHYLIITINL